MNYTESKKKLDAIRQKYGCKGELIFRTAIQNVVDYGKSCLLDKDWYKGTIDDIDTKHDHAEANGKFLWCTRDFEKAIVDCSVELCSVETYDLLIYVQREVWLSGDGIDYQRAIELCKGAINLMVGDSYETDIALEQVRDMGFSDDEIDELGLDDFDRRMLKTIITNYGGGPVGLDTLAAAVGEESITIEEVYEPYLMQIGLLTRTGRGRCVTRLAYEHLGMKPRHNKSAEQLDMFDEQ
jgi:hypothetical protein